MGVKTLVLLLPSNLAARTYVSELFVVFLSSIE